MKNKVWSPAFEVQKRLIQELRDEIAMVRNRTENAGTRLHGEITEAISRVTALSIRVSELYLQHRNLVDRVARIEKGQVVDLKELEKALGVKESES